MAENSHGEGTGRGVTLWGRIAQFLGVRPGHLPWVTVTIIVACVLVGLAELFSQQVGTSLLFVPFLAESQPYRFLGSAFLHGGFWHLVFNMYALWLVGNALEPVIGRVRFAAIYLLSAVAGNVAVLITADPLAPSWGTATVGASGAVFGVFGALFVLMRHFGADSTSLMVVILANLGLGFIPGMNISWQSHVGGLIVGAVTMALMTANRAHTTPTRRRIQDVTAVVVVALALTGLILWTLR